ncbi:helix-turn-helix domain-containing protein [Mongoliitalea lutea]|uniref:HTH araC/xylS-type domain-containing protein n=1 Tax=Mongoliitalea lutea TaxID=849756 RepID=A0A8J3CVY5_9BACT|nr:helix-turn-helix domain-containing protein [Mongoliitalea lutea]GHB25493.1 hypothetical protein GCM10008106_02830 [Mongoliitalea lutea]
MGEGFQIPIYRDFNEYYEAANTCMRARDKEFHAFRFSDLGEDIVPSMGPFSVGFFQIAIGSELAAEVGVFDLKEDIQEFTMVIYLPGQILYWEKKGIWDGYVIHVKEPFLHLDNISHLTESFGFLHSVKPLVVSLNREQYELMGQFFELILKEGTPFNEESRLVVRNLLQVIVVYINRIVSKNNPHGDYTELQYHKIATKFKALVIEHFINEKSVGFYGNSLGISTSYLADAVKKVFQTTPKNIINEITYLHAKTLLSSTDMGIKELAWTLNFDDYSHFVKFFKKMSGLTPAAFRKTLKKEG